MFGRLHTFIRRCRHRPMEIEYAIAARTSEAPFEVNERLREAALASPFTIAEVIAVEAARLDFRPSMTLTDALDIVAASRAYVEPWTAADDFDLFAAIKRRLGLVEVLYGKRVVR